MIATVAIAAPANQKASAESPRIASDPRTISGLKIAPTPNIVCINASRGPTRSLSSQTMRVLHPTSDVETAAPKHKNIKARTILVETKGMIAKQDAAISSDVPIKRFPKPRSYPRANICVPIM